MNRFTLRLLAIGLLSLSGFASAATPVHEYQLDNGLKLLVRPDRRAPVVVSQVWYKVGSSYEHRGITGVSHVLEHMMFKGTDRLGPNEFSHIIAREGGKENAFTGRDYTAYFQQLAADRLEISFELEADRMANLKLDQAEFAKEVQVVMEERRLRTEDNPIAQGLERFNFIAYPVSPYRIPVIGWMSDLRNLQLADLQEWYRRFYAPNNAVVVVVGNVDPEAVHALARKHFGKVASRELPAPKPVLEQMAVGERRLTTELPAEIPFLAIGFETPSLRTAVEPWETYALDVLATVLDGGSGARLVSQLVREQELAAGISADYGMASRLNTQFTVTAYPNQRTPLDKLEQAVLAELERTRREPVSAEELQRAKNQLIADHLYRLDSNFYQAMQLGILETSGVGWRRLLEYEQSVRAITAEQIRTVAERYLIPERRTVLHLKPQPRQEGAQ